MDQIASEEILVAVCRSLIPPGADLTIAEIALSKHRVVYPEPTLLSWVREGIAQGQDPLGSAFMKLRSAAHRRQDGAVYTPESIIKSMIEWSAQEIEPARVIDAGAGSGRFLLAAAERFPRAHLIGVEQDPLGALMLRANVAVRGLCERSTVVLSDYRDLLLPQIDQPTLFIGNPPYVRHHDISAGWKRWYAELASSFGERASKLAGLHLHFFIKTLQLGRRGDSGTFITSAEWLDVNYGQTLRRLLARGLGGSALHIIDPRAMPFDEVMTSAAITCFRIGNRPETLKVRSVSSLASLNTLASGREFPWSEVIKVSRWSSIVRPAPELPKDYIELGELFRVSRGQVTGQNEIWIAGEHSRELPESVLCPAITRARELFAAGDALTSVEHLRRVVNLPVQLDDVEPAYRDAVKRFLRWARSKGAADSYIAKHRRAWWSVLLYEPAPIICTYMARRPPAFVRNICGARHLNIAHGLYPREPLDEGMVSALLTYLRQHVGVSSGRTYAGGLTKFEPGELERIRVPGLEQLKSASGAQMEQTAAHGRRGRGAFHFSQGASRGTTSEVDEGVRRIQR